MNIISSHAIIHDDAELGDNNRIGPFVVIGPNVKIGDNNQITGHASIGQPGEHKDFFEFDGRVEIGNNNVIREFVTINAGTHWVTAIGDRCIMLRGSHLSHDSRLEDDVTISCSVLVGGESYVMTGANIGLGAILHQRQLVGSYSMIGMGSVATKGLSIVPGNVYCGVPAKFLKKNDVGLSRSMVSDEILIKEINRYAELKRMRAEQD